MHWEPMRILVVEVFGKFCRFLSTSTGAFIIALLSVLGAALISIYSTKILSEINYIFFSGPETKLYELFVSLAVSIIAVLFVAFRELGLAEKLRAKEQELEQQRIDIDERNEVQRLEMEKRLTSMPPKSFLALYTKSIKNSGQLRRASKVQVEADKVTFEDINKRVRILMNTVLSLARSWDGVSKENHSIVYKSNVMLSISSGALRKHSSEKSGVEMLDLMTKSKFFLHNQNEDAILDRCDGVLILLNNQYSTSSISPDDGPDPDIRPICFPYTRRQASGKMNPLFHPNLPGAPEAMSTGEAQYMDHTSRTMKAWLESIGDLNGLIHKQYKDGIDDYYRERYEAQSILAIPLKINNKIFAILNIYRNDPEILLNRSRSEQFVTLLEPVCYQLAKMLFLASKSKTLKEVRS